jgi:hypothetical protein
MEDAFCISHLYITRRRRTILIASAVDRLAVRKDRCYTVAMRDRFFFPLCAAAAIAMIALAMIGPGAADAARPEPAVQTQEKAQ